MLREKEKKTRIEKLPFMSNLKKVVNLPAIPSINNKLSTIMKYDEKPKRKSIVKDESDTNINKQITLPDPKSSPDKKNKINYVKLVLIYKIFSLLLNGVIIET
jgi:hypothetical protein